MISRRVPVFSAVDLNRILHWVSPRRAVGMCEELKAFPINGGNAVRLVDLTRSDDESPSSLTAFDARVAAGEYGTSRTERMGELRKRERESMGKRTEDAVESSHNRMRFWKELHDEKAVLV